MSRTNPKEQAQRQAQARLRAELILKVRSGLMTAAAAAKALGVSRKTYYKWEKRALGGMMEALCERDSGRPASEPDEEKERLKRTVTELERELRLRQQSEELRKLLRSEMEKKG
jgi:DNA-binding XRE family transcriptional regulator